MNNEYKEIIINSGLDFSNYKSHYKTDDSVSDYLTNWEKRVLYIPNKFDSEYYLNSYEDVLNSGFNPLIHYILFGENEGRIAIERSESAADDFLSFMLNISKNIGDKVEIQTLRTLKLNGELYLSPFINIEYIEKKIEEKQLSSHSNNVVHYAYLLNKKEDAIPYSQLVESFSKLYDLSFNESLEKIVTLFKFLDLRTERDIQIFLAMDFISKADISLIKSTDSLEDFCFESKAIYFITSYYSKVSKVSFSNSIEAFKHWRENSLHLPTPLFDIEVYKSNNKDLVGDDIVLFEHFLLHGQYEGRIHNNLLSFVSSPVKFPIKNTKNALLNCKDEFLSQSVKLFLKNNFGKSNPTFEEWYAIFEILGEIKAFNGKDTQIPLFLAMFDIDELKYQTKERDFITCIKNWKISNFHYDFSPFFASDFVKKQIPDSSELNTIETFNLWFKLRDRIESSPLFDSNYYLESNFDLITFNKPLIEHFIYHGIFENRSPSIFLNLAWIAFFYGTSNERNAAAFFFKSEYSGCNIKSAPQIASLFNSEFARLNDFALNALSTETLFTDKEELAKQITLASMIEPMIKANNPSLPITFMPFNVDNFPYLRELPKIIGSADILIFRDSINFGGADAVLSSLVHSLKEIYAEKVIKIISLSRVSLEALQIHNIDRDIVFDLQSLVFDHCHPKNQSLIACDVVYDILIGSECTQVFNVNCGVLWEVKTLYYRQLRNNLKFYAYLFCDDRDAYGNVDGYPSRYLLNTLGLTDFYLVDSESLKKEIGVRTNNAESVQNKIVHIQTPCALTELELIDYRLNNYPTKNIVWAGRFDHQKRPDLLISIAKLMPDFTFYVWGKPVLNQKAYNFSECKNIKLMGLFNDISEVRSVEPLLFLYTSEWDGVPTILIKVMEEGLPIVASNAGGVSELIPSSHIVNNINDAEEYKDKILSAATFNEGKLEAMYKDALLSRTYLAYKEKLCKALKGVEE